MASPHAPAYVIDGATASREAFYARACDPTASVVVEACAGAGKTWMLVSRILRALLDGTRPEQILAITFTRRAAGEMRARLQEWLFELAAPQSSHAQRVQALVERGVTALEADRLAPVLANLHEQLLAHGRGVEVRTFHAWFGQLLRAAPLDLLAELGLHPAVELIEDVDELRPDVFRRFHAAVAADPLLRTDHAALVQARGRSAVRRWLLAAWERRIEIELAEAAGVLAGSVATAQAQWPAYADFAHPAQRLHSESVRALLSRVAGALGSHHKATARRQAAQLEAALTHADAPQALAAARLALLTDKGVLRAHLEAPELEAAVATIAEIERAVAQHDAAVEHRCMARLSMVLLAEYAALKRLRGLADMVDLERVALALMREATLAGWVQERLDARIRHLLIDEFQDTSPLQWHALHAWLAGYAGAGGGASGQQPPSVFIVGDPKQSIYRFRRAEPRVFACASEFVVNALGGSVLACDHTRRMSAAVLSTVNRVFGAADTPWRFDGFREHTTEVQGSGPAPDAPRVYALPAIERESAAPQARDRSGAVWRDSLTTPRDRAREALRQREARRTAGEILAVLDDGTAPGEVMVLARNRASLNRLAAELQALHVPFAAPEPLALLDSPEVRDLVAVLDALASPAHDLSLAHALRSPLFGADDEDLLRVADAAAAHRGRWWDALFALPQPGPVLQRACELLARWQEAAVRLPPHDLLDRIVGEGDLRARVAAATPPERRRAALSAIDALLAQSLRLDGGRYPTIYGFVRAVRRRPIEFVAETAPDAVQLLTIHGAKGLEAPAVFVMDCDAEQRDPATSTLLVDWPVEAQQPRRVAFIASEARCPPSLQQLMEAELAARRREELNALYVAVTRAGEQLVFSRTEPHRPSADSWWRWLAPVVATQARPQAVGPASLAAQAVRSVRELPPLMMPSAVDNGRAQPALVDDLAVRLGQAVHRVLEWATGPVPNTDLDRLARAALQELRAPAVAAERVVSVVRAILNSAPCRRFFDRSALRWAGNEVVVCDGDEILRIDRLVACHEAGAERGDVVQWWVLDYKLNHEPEALGAYRAQLRRYRDLVRAMQPQANVRAAFITGRGELIEPDLERAADR